MHASSEAGPTDDPARRSQCTAPAQTKVSALPAHIFCNRFWVPFFLLNGSYFPPRKRCIDSLASYAPAPKIRTIDSVDRSAFHGASTPDTSAIAAGAITAPAFRFCLGRIAEGPPAFIVCANLDAALLAGHDRFGGRGG